MVRTFQGSSAPGWLGRDLRLLWGMAAMLLRYVTAGARQRRAYRRCQARGEVYLLDAIDPSGDREERSPR